jgi:hypothetical protein
MPNLSSTRCENDTTVESNPLHNKIEHSQINNEQKWVAISRITLIVFPISVGLKWLF